MCETVLTLIFTPRAQPNGSLLCSDSFDYRVDDFQAKSGPLLDASSIVIRPLVGHVLQELINQVAIRTVDFDTVESGRNSFLSGGRIQLNVFMNLVESECARLGGIWTGSGEFDWRGSDERVASEVFGSCSSTESPQLDIDK